jgi:hypothetical protein
LTGGVDDIGVRESIYRHSGRTSVSNLGAFATMYVANGSDGAPAH